jgi:hypothetical protein
MAVDSLNCQSEGSTLVRLSIQFVSVTTTLVRKDNVDDDTGNDDQDKEQGHQRGKLTTSARGTEGSNRGVGAVLNRGDESQTDNHHNKGSEQRAHADLGTVILRKELHEESIAPHYPVGSRGT